MPIEETKPTPDPAPATTAPDPAPGPGGPSPPPVSATAPEPQPGAPVTMSSRVLKERLDRATETGRTKAAKDLEEKAKKYGFTTVDAMFAHMEQRSTGGGKPNPKPAQPGAKPNAGGDPAKPSSRTERKQEARNTRDVERAHKERDQANLRAKTEERRRRDLQRQKDALEARTSLERLAAQKGIRDSDYAIHLLTRHLDGQNDEAINAFDEGKFFEGLRGQHSYLFGEVVIPATTGTGANNPQPPSPGVVTDKNATDGKTDANKMSREQYQEHLQKRGINPYALQ